MARDLFSLMQTPGAVSVRGKPGAQQTFFNPATTGEFKAGSRGEIKGQAGMFVAARDITSASLIGASPEQAEAINRTLGTGMPSMMRGLSQIGGSLGRSIAQRRSMFGPQGGTGMTVFIPDAVQQPAGPAGPAPAQGGPAPGDPTNLAAAAERQDAAAAAREGASDPLVAGRREALLARRGKNKGVGLAPLGRGFASTDLLATTPV